jgi:hypothetical protein
MAATNTCGVVVVTGMNPSRDIATMIGARIYYTHYPGA